jgi:hypothetical protein
MWRRFWDLADADREELKALYPTLWEVLDPRIYEWQYWRGGWIFRHTDLRPY